MLKFKLEKSEIAIPAEEQCQTLLLAGEDVPEWSADTDKMIMQQPERQVIHIQEYMADDDYLKIA